MKETTNKIERSDIWKQIYGIIDKLELVHSEEDSYDKPSITTELERLFIKLYNKPAFEEVRFPKIKSTFGKTLASDIVPVQALKSDLPKDFTFTTCTGKETIDYRELNDYLPIAKENEVVFRLILDYLNTNHEGMSMDEIHETYSEGARWGIWTILGFKKISDEIYQLSFQDIAPLSGYGCVNQYEYKDGKISFYKQIYGWRS